MEMELVLKLEYELGKVLVLELEVRLDYPLVMKLVEWLVLDSDVE
jgi:hypothetical protein